MAEFAVWAPLAQSMDLMCDGLRVPMLAAKHGWWHKDIPADCDIRYGFAPDGAEQVYPDPRSRRQPDGVHALSARFDASTFDWTDQDWAGRPLVGAVIYELHIGTFTTNGTLDAAVEKLDHLVDLGVDIVELLPVAAFNGPRNWGYDGTCWFAVDECYGGPESYLRFVDACHARGIGIIQDVVYNHLGPSGNYLSVFGPYLTAGSNTWGDNVNLDGRDSDQVRSYILDNVAMWLRDYHVDGLRLDAVHAFADRGAVHILEQIAALAADISAERGFELAVIAESDLNDPRLITPTTRGGYGLRAQWNDDFHHVVHVALTGETDGYYADFGMMSDIAKVLREGFFHDGCYSSFRGRRHGRPLDTAAVHPSSLVVCTSNHDQVGNRAAGDRPCAHLSTDALAAGAALLMCSPFTPMLFMGEEWGASSPWQFFTGHSEPELADAVRAGRLTEFAQMGWDISKVPDPQHDSTFTRSVLNWSEVSSGQHARLLAWYRALIALRRDFPGIAADPWSQLAVDCDDQARTLTVQRGGVFLAICLADGHVRVRCAGAGAVLLDSGVTVSDTPTLAGRGDGWAELDGPGAVIFRA